MSASILMTPVAPALPIASTGAIAPRWALLGTILVVGVAFFLSEHDLHVSQAVSYTQTAEEMEIAAGGGNSIRRLAFLVVAGWGLLLLATARGKLRLDPLLATTIGLVLAWAGISFLWADDSGMCLRRLMVLGCCVLAAAGIARRLSMSDLSWLAIGTMGTLAIVGILAELSLGTFRPWAADYRFAGTLHPNTQGPCLVAVILAALGLARRNGVRGGFWLWGVVLVAFGLLLLTKSRTSAAAVFVAVGAVAIAQTSWRLKCVAGAGLLWLAGLGLLSLWLSGVDPLSDFRDALLLGRAEESDTLSGRAFIWPEVLSFASQRPFFGYGYESFWTPERIETISTALGWGLREAHNAYLEMLLSLGVVGLVLMLSVVATGVLAAVRGYRDQRDPTYTLPLGMLVFGLLNAGLESGIVVVELVTFVLACCLLQMALFRNPALCRT